MRFLLLCLFATVAVSGQDEAKKDEAAPKEGEAPAEGEAKEGEEAPAEASSDDYVKKAANDQCNATEAQSGCVEGYRCMMMKANFEKEFDDEFKNKNFKLIKQWEGESKWTCQPEGLCDKKCTKDDGCKISKFLEDGNEISNECGASTLVASAISLLAIASLS